MSLTPRQLWIRRIEAMTGLAPLNFMMARYIEAYNITGRDSLIEAIATKELIGIGEGTINKLKMLVGLPVKAKKPRTDKATGTLPTCVQRSSPC